MKPAARARSVISIPFRMSHPKHRACLRRMPRSHRDNRHISRPAREQPRTDRRRALGRLGESLAADHLERRGFAILDRNVRIGRGEIDLIAFDGITLAFVEVKTRRQRTCARSCQATATSATAAVAAAHADTGASGAAMPLSPLEGLRSAQRLRQRRLASAWLQEHAPTPRARDLRFDAIGIVVDENGRLLRLEHIEGAW